MRARRATPTTIHAPMGRSGRWRAAIVAMLAVLATAAPVAAQQPVDPWLVVDPTFEPLDGAPLGVDGLGEFRGSIRLTRSGNGVAVVNHLPLDDYLRGISEVPTSWPLEAQKAQAIAARTYALHEVGRTGVNASYKAVGADICATDSCQVYTGLTKERRPGSEAWIAAVEQTSGQVLTYKGAPIVAKYSSSNGGQTVPGGQPYLRAAPDPDDAYSPLHRWRVSYPVADVARVVGLAAEPTTLTRQGDEIVATYVDPAGGSVEQRLPVADFRSRINNGFPTPSGVPLPVPSVRFDAAAAEGLVVIDGRGWGHGIGLSQYGALGKALRGMRAPEILAAYYAGLKPVAFPADRLPPQVRVALALDRGEATVTNPSGRFRIRDGEGRVVAHSATGAWGALPGPRGAVRLVPPVDQAGPPTAALAGVEPAAPRPGEAITAKIDLQGPAAVTGVTLTSPGGETRRLDEPRLRLPGPLTVRLGAGTTAVPGAYRIDLEQDAGGGRTATTSITLDVVDATAAAVPGPPAAADGPVGPAEGDGAAAATGLATIVPAGVFKGLATVLFLAVAAAGAASVGRRPGLQLH